MTDEIVLACYLAANGTVALVLAVGMAWRPAVQSLKTLTWLVAWLLALAVLVTWAVIGSAIMSPWFTLTWLREWRREHGKRGVKC